MRRLSKPITELKPHYEVLIIGSGYGGSIAASRMARAGKQVALLEKGKEFLPGEFPKGLVEASGEMQFHKGKSNLGDENGLYEFVIGNEISVFKGCGLGGTSLVNANVSIKPDPRVFEDPIWPQAIKDDMESVHQGYERAWDMLKPNPYPEGKMGYPVLKKTEAMRKSAEQMNEEFRLLDINVTFESKENHVGTPQKNCTNCGDCVTGCNRSAKNTTAMNYLPDAFNHGAEIFTELGVEYLEKVGDGWRVYFKAYGTGREKFKAPFMFVKADHVIISAGSLGSTEILMRSAQKGLSLSGTLGQRFTGNGDVLGFGYNCDQEIHGVGRGEAAFQEEITNVGPCITSVIDMRKNYDLKDGMTLEEGSVPSPIKSILVPTLLAASRLIGKDTDRGFIDYLKEKWREIKSSFGGVYRGAVDNTQIYLVMSNDDGDGEMYLNDDHLNIKWKDVGKQEIFKKVNQKLKDATTALGGNFIKNPSWTKALDYDLVTVHPLGGCSMGDNGKTGVVDHKGQAFSGDGDELHKGLYVMDGAVLPRPVGTNPLLTISALSERNVRLIAQDMGADFNYDFNPVPRGKSEDKLGVQFTETMKGYFSKNEKEDFEAGFEKGKSDDSPFEFTLTIRASDVDLFVTDKAHQAPMIGTMEAPALSTHPLMAQKGTFNLFEEDDSNPDLKKMLYSAELHATEGDVFFFEGYKLVENDKGFDVWKDTTTLFITVYEGNSNQGEVLGKGKLIIEIDDFARQLTTMKALNDKDGGGLKAVATFGKFFAGNVFDTYFKP